MFKNIIIIRKTFKWEIYNFDLIYSRESCIREYLLYPLMSFRFAILIRLRRPLMSSTGSVRLIAISFLYTLVVCSLYIWSIFWFHKLWQNLLFYRPLILYRFIITFKCKKRFDCMTIFSLVTYSKKNKEN